MAPRVFGLETEYAVAELRAGGRPEGFVEGLMDVATRRLPHLRGHGDAGLFLTNGSRLYQDVGGHPELATAEVQDPWDAVRYVKAGDRIMQGLAAALKAENPRFDPLVLRGNVDYGGTDATWGCHESYMHTSRLRPEALAAQLIPHLVSRIVFAGAGGFNPRSAGIEFTLSPRAWHLHEAISSSSTGNRGIFHTREESLCGPGYRRLHLLCGDSLRSETALWLTVATTALVVALIEGGKSPGDAVRLRDPVRALRLFAADPALRAQVSMPSGRRATAIAIQRHYLEQAERHAGAGFMPGWAPDACERWRRALDRLQRSPHESARALDWQIKLALYREQVRRSPLTGAQIAHWNSLVTETPAPPDPEPRTPGRRVTLADRLRAARREPRPSPAESRLLARGVSATDARPFLELRARLLDMETRYGALGAEGVFDGLERAGALHHRLLTDAEIEEATVHPPAVGRARLRGEAVRRLAPGGKATCSWNSVVDGDGRRILDLANPFEIREKWRPAPDPPPRRPPSLEAANLAQFLIFDETGYDPP